MFTLKIVYQCLPGNWFINVYLETDLAVFTWKQVYQCLSWNWFSNVYLETGLATFNWKTGLSMFTWQLDYQCLSGNRFINVYLETGLAKFTWKSGLLMFTLKLVPGRWIFIPVSVSKTDASKIKVIKMINYHNYLKQYSHHFVSASWLKIKSYKLKNIDSINDLEHEQQLIFEMV